VTPDFQNGLTLGLTVASAVWLALSAWWLVKVSRQVKEARLEIAELTAALGGAMDECKKLREQARRNSEWLKKCAGGSFSP